MIKNYILIQISLLFWLAMAFFIIALSFNNQPSIIDEFCFAYVGRDYGVFQGAYMYYTNWSGRYFTNILFHLNPLVFSTNFKLFSITPILLLFLGFANGFWVIKNFLKEEFKSAKLWMMALLFQAICWYLIPSIYQIFYWFPAFFYYLSFHLVLLLINLRYFIPHFKGKNVLYVFLVWAIIGTSEITMLYFSALFSGYLFLSFLNKSLDKRKVGLGLFALTCVAVVILAPGNATRAGSQAKNWALILFNASHFSIQTLKEFLQQPILYFWLLIVVYLSVLEDRNRWLVQKRELLFYSLAFVLAYFLGFLALSIGLNEPEMPLRVIGLVDFYLIVFISLIVYLVAQRFLHQIQLLKLDFIPFLALCGLLIFCLQNANLKELYREWRFEKQAQFAKENKMRFDKIKNAKTEIVTIEPIKFKETMFFSGDFSTDSTHLWCRCVAKYYGKKAVYLKTN